VRDIVAHLVSAEDGLRAVVQDIVSGGGGAPPGLDHDEINASEQVRLGGVPAAQLVCALANSRQETIRWVASLSEADLGLVGRHPALGEITVAAHLTAMYGHGVMHLRDLRRALRDDKAQHRDTL
jgi:hypothetical protein